MQQTLIKRHFVVGSGLDITQNNFQVIMMGSGLDITQNDFQVLMKNFVLVTSLKILQSDWLMNRKDIVIMILQGAKQWFTNYVAML